MSSTPNQAMAANPVQSAKAILHLHAEATAQAAPAMELTHAWLPALMGASLFVVSAQSSHGSDPHTDDHRHPAFAGSKRRIGSICMD